VNLNRIRIAAAIAGTLGFLYFMFLVAMFGVMQQPPQRFGQIMRHIPMPLLAIVPFESMWNSARGGTLNVGDQAPDFTLPRSDKSGDVTLSSLRGKPVVLVFGSYT
jgi:cytochrome oxidase Cu insertion factor (SCO1/SenC/PrrC family)